MLPFLALLKSIYSFSYRSILTPTCRTLPSNAALGTPNVEGRVFPVTTLVTLTKLVLLVIFITSRVNLKFRFSLNWGSWVKLKSNVPKPGPRKALRLKPTKRSVTRSRLSSWLVTGEKGWPEIALPMLLILRFQMGLYRNYLAQ